VAAFPRLAARFSFNDFPDFLDMVCRGDLSDIAAPFDHGGLVGPDCLTILLWRSTGVRAAAAEPPVDTTHRV
jgi:hypothetical protein